MASSAEFLEYVLDLLRETPGISYRKMMGEYVLYADGVVFDGIYDDRFLVKNVPAAREALPDAALVTPYPGGTDMLTVDTEDPAFLAETITAMLPEIPRKKEKKAAK